jgi:predicted O-methyltransferase YrrM
VITVVDGWGSHIPMLLTAFQSTHGPVLELGAGHFSTPILHSLCHATRRPLLTLESDAAWIKKFVGLESDVHELRLVMSWDEIESVIDDSWGLVFIDHSPSELRAEALRKVTGGTVVVIHDAERKDGGLRDVMGEFRYSVIDKARHRQPWTAALSHRPLPFARVT